MNRADDLPGLTLRQPWAWAVIYGGKNIENRDKRTSVTGRFVVHAAAACDPETDYKAAVHWMVARGLVRSETWPELAPVDPAFAPQFSKAPILPDIEELPLGVIVGTAELVGTIDRNDEVGGWKMIGRYGYRLANPKPCVEKSFRGKPGWFYVPKKLIREKAAPAFTLGLVDRLNHSHAVICAKCKRPVDSVAMTRDDGGLKTTLAIRAFCHGKKFDHTFTEEELMKIATEGLRTFEVFT